MYEDNAQSILRCDLCNKPFDKQPSLKRHGYYCRSRRAGTTTRSRSCVPCAKKKARCDNRRPECSRCITKGNKCHYQPNTLEDSGPSIQQSDHVPIEREKRALSLVADVSNVETGQEASNEDGNILDNALLLPDLEFTGPEGELVNQGDLDINFADFLGSQMNDETVQYPSLGPSSLVRHSTPSRNRVLEAISSPVVSIPTQPTHTVRSLIHRPKVKTGADRIANLMLHTLKSYPVVMLRNGNLPPFIHPQLLSFDVEDDHLEPLTNCISLVHMVSSGVQGNRKLFWKNVRFECERFCADHLNWNKWELLTAVQALLIYIIIRVDEGETDHNNFDFLLLTTVTVMFKQFADLTITYNTEAALYDYGLETSWKDWIFEESRRRLCVAYRVVNMLVYFEPAKMCDMQSDLILAPLPAKKQLWEAGDEFVWKAESEREADVQTAFGLTVKGELVKLDRSRLHCNGVMLLHDSSDRRTPLCNTTNWEEWCSGMDGFGGLVMLAASLTV